MAETVLIGPHAWQEAKRRALFGHKQWIAWIEDETQHAAWVTAATLKRGMMASGTQGKMLNYGYGSAFIVSWPIACNMLRQARRGYY